MELLHAFGFDIRIFLAQMINFAVLLLILYRFAYHPILNLLDERKAKIEQGLKYASEAGDRLDTAREEAKRILEETRAEARGIVENAHETARKTAQTILDASKVSADKMIEDARKKMEAERNRIMNEARIELAGIVMSVTGKVLREKIDARKDEEIIQRHLNETK